MKHKTYGDNNNEFEYGSGIEIISSGDPISARSVNRPIVNLYENEEETYKLLNTLIKSVYGNINNAILPDVYENFASEGFVINSFKNDATKFFLRIPTGMMILNNHKNKFTKNKGNPFSKPGEFDYIDDISKSNFIKDIDGSFIYDNRPNISLLERQLANFIALDLTDLTNDINIHEIEIPMAYNIAITDPSTKFQLFDADGNLSYLSDNGGNQLFVCEDEKAEYYLEGVKYLETDIEYNYKPCGNNEKFSGDFNLEKSRYYYIDKVPDKKMEELLVPARQVTKKSPTATPLTSNYDEAICIKDYNGNKKNRIGYYVDITRATDQDDEISYLPNKKENASWKICLPEAGDKSQSNREHRYTYVIEFTDNNDSPLISFEFFFFDYISEDSINNLLFNKLLIEGLDYFNLTKYQFRKGSELKHGVKISTKSESKNCDKYKLKISYYENEDKDNKKICKTLDESTGYPKNEINNVLPNPSHRQKCYNNIFELTNAFLGKFSSYQVDITNIYNYMSGESIITLPSGGSTFSLYYDLNSNSLDNGNNIRYDKSGRLLLVTDKNLDSTNDNLIKLFDFEIDRPSSVGLAPKIKKLKRYPLDLDRRSIQTKYAEYDTLVSNSRTELNNYIVMGDGERKIEIAEDAESSDKQTRITSPVLRLSTKNNTLGSDSGWSDNKGGDDESDFRDSYKTRNFIDNSTKTNYHNDSDMGIIINGNKGIKIYSNDLEKTKGSHTKINSYKPIEISNNLGNINILASEKLIGEKDIPSARINIKNLKDGKNNLIDMLGVTRVRSSNDVPFVVKRITEKPKLKSEEVTTNNASSIAFVSGYSTAEENINALDNIEGHKDDDVIIGKINFYHGEDYRDSPNKLTNNRMVSLELSSPGETNNQNKLFTGRGAHSGNGKKIFTLFGDMSPSNELYSLGFPKGSRTYSENNLVIPYNNEERADIQVDGNGNSTECLGDEGRWLSAFVKYGYFDKVTLSDTCTESSLKNSDERNGSLRLGNSNIYDVSSIYINYDGNNRDNEGTINFDNRCDGGTYENTICSYSEKALGNSSLNFILNRKTRTRLLSTEKDTNHTNGLNLLSITNKGSRFAKDVFVNRQLFVNNHSDATNYDNISFVVKGQSILNGELILGAKLNDVETDVYSTVSGYNRNNSMDHPNKLYNKEFNYEGEYNNLYTFRNYGLSLLSGDLTLKGKLTESALFDKKITINNHAYNGKSYDEKLTSGSQDKLYFTNNHASEDYIPPKEGETSKCSTSSRHHVALDVTNGTILLGNQETYNGQMDNSDLKLFGSQWIKRRLEIGTENSTLIDTYMYDGKLIEYKNKSPSLYVKGASVFDNDVVFGGGLLNTDYTDKDNKKFSSKVLRHSRGSDTDINPVKVIFWGDNDISTSSTGITNPDYNKTDFDFHGHTWFDNIVKIGGGATGKYSKSNIGRILIHGSSEYPKIKNPENGELDVASWRTNSVTESIEGTLSVYGRGYNELIGKYINIDSIDEDAASKSSMKISNSSIELKSAGNISISSDTANISSTSLNVEGSSSTIIKASAGPVKILSGQGVTGIVVDNSAKTSTIGINSTELNIGSKTTITNSLLANSIESVGLTKTNTLQVSTSTSAGELTATTISVSGEATFKEDATFEKNINVNSMISYSNITALGYIKAKSSNISESITCKSITCEVVNATTLNGSVEKASKVDLLWLVNNIYPVGSLFWNTNDEDPEKMFPGTTWKKIEDTFILAKGPKYKKDGGKSSVTLEINNIPSHDHRIDSYTESSTTGVKVLSDGSTHRHRYDTWFSAGGDKGWSREGSLGTDWTPWGGEHTHEIKDDGHTHKIDCSTLSTGEGKAFDIMPPYKVANCWERIG